MAKLRFVNCCTNKRIWMNEWINEWMNLSLWMWLITSLLWLWLTSQQSGESRGARLLCSTKHYSVWTYYLRVSIFLTSWQFWCLLNRFRTGQWECVACQHQWRLQMPVWSDPDNVSRRGRMSDIEILRQRIVAPTFGWWCCSFLAERCGDKGVREMNEIIMRVGLLVDYKKIVSIVHDIIPYVPAIACVVNSCCDRQFSSFLT